MRRDLYTQYASPTSRVAKPQGRSAGSARDRAIDAARDPRTNRRFVTQSHALGAPMASPGSLVIAAAVAVALFLVARRISD